MPHLTPEEAVAVTERGFAPGTPIGEYEVQSFLGEGGFGSVYRVIHPVIGKSAAIKILKREYSTKPEIVARFVSEARAVNQIRHKNIIDIFAFGKLPDGTQYFVMGLLEGEPLSELLERERLPIDRALPMLKQLAKALGAAHAAGITHRDIKPENVFVTHDDEGKIVPKLLDFGIAKLVVDNLSQHKTRSGMPMGTPLYMSPEQVHGKAVDARSDIYSFGVMVFQILTGRLPFDGDTMMMVMMKQVNERPPTPSSVDPSLPASVDGPLLRMLEKDPALRPSSVVAAVDELARSLGDVGVVSGPVVSPSASAQRTPASTGASTPIRFSAQTPAKSPSELTLAALGASDTLIASEAPSGQSFIESSPPKRGRSRAGFVAVGLVAFAGLAAFGWVATRKAPSEGGAGTSPATTQTATAGGAETVVIAPAPDHSADGSAPGARATESGKTDSAVTARASTSAVERETVRLKIKANVEGAEVWLEKTRLGLVGEDLSLARGDRELVLTIRKPGYAPATLKVKPTGDLAEPVILQKQGGAAPKEYGPF